MPKRKRKLKGTDRTLVEQMIEHAAEISGVSKEQSRKNIRAALSFVQETVQKQGFFDFSGLGLFGVFARPIEKINNGRRDDE